MDFMTFKERMHPFGCFSVNHLLFKESNADRILQFAEVVQAL